MNASITIIFTAVRVIHGVKDAIFPSFHFKSSTSLLFQLNFLSTTLMNNNLKKPVLVFRKNNTQHTSKTTTTKNNYYCVL